MPDVEEDPVTAEYDVYITPELEEQIYLLQYPNRGREQPYNDRNNAKPLEMRLKPESGFIEMDVPMNVYANYDRRKGVTWGEAILKAQEHGESHFGMASGFSGLARPPPARGAAAAAQAQAQNAHEDDEMTIEQLLQRFDDANDKGHVMNKQTLGGQILKDESEKGKPMYMLGAFRGKELHLTKITGIVQMRPQFHHLDALRDVANAARRKEKEANEAPRQGEPRAVQMTIKTEYGADSEEAKTKDFLRKAQEEKWTKLRFYDEDTDEAYNTYHEKLFVDDPENAAKLVSSMNNEEYLDAISAERHDPSGHSTKKPLTRRQYQRIQDSEESDDGEDEVPKKAAEETNEGAMDVDQE
ncbi:hypothetical protein K490DRAFT_69574 [Saccharata proteae CBS 121410]|uniref:DNA-directed RNA polymerase III subunit Rpc5 n=1 Tax=Saccharata proteae CBS 121410 TaxID=1314787 RepID=A0A9P4HNA5_9PEZI|nr:hypothetical protein K490DRAFT_69574 [Saccharata proteae CBS 121410]